MAVDWALKRFLKFVLKRKLGRYLHELDLDALDVELGSGTVELRQLLLKCDAITEDLNLNGWEVRACYIGTVRAQLPFSALGTTGNCCRVEADELLVTVAAVPLDPNWVPSQRDSGASAGLAGDPALTSAASDHALDELGLLTGAAGMSGVDEVVKIIANGLHTLLQRLSVSVTNILVRVEFPAASASASASDDTVAVLSVNIDSFQLWDASVEKPALPGDAAAAARDAAAAAAADSASSGRSWGWWGGSSSSGGAAPAAAASATRAPVPPPTPPAQAAAMYAAGTYPGPAAQPAAAATAPAAAAAADGNHSKLAELKGLSVHLTMGTRVELSKDDNQTDTAAQQHSNGLNGHATVATAAANSGSSSRACTTALLTSPDDGGVSVSLQLTVTAAVAGVAAAPGATAHAAAAKVSAAVQLGACRLQLLPGHYTALAAVMHHLRQQQAAAAAAAAVAASPRADMEQPVGTIPPWEDPARVYHADPARALALYGTAALPGADAAHAAGQNVWGTSSLLGSFLLDDYQDLVCMSLQPYVAQSLSMADSRMSDGGQDCFQDARSVFSSMPPSQMNSMHSAMQASFMTAASSHHPYSSLHSPTAHTHARSTTSFPTSPTNQLPTSPHQQTTSTSPRVPQPPPQTYTLPQPPPPPEYELSLRATECQFFVSNVDPHVSTAGVYGGHIQGGSEGGSALLVTCSDVRVSLNATAGDSNLMVELQQLSGMELMRAELAPAAPAAPGKKNPRRSEAAASAAARVVVLLQPALEFAAMPSKVQKSAHCYRPDPTWLTVPTWLTPPPPAAPTRGHTPPHTPPDSAVWVPSPLCYCAAGLRAAGIRPSVTIRAHQTATGAGPGAGTTGGGGAPGALLGGVAADPYAYAAIAATSAAAAGGPVAPDAGAARVQVDLLPVTLWVCGESLKRVNAALAPLTRALQGTDAGSSTATQPPTRQSGNGSATADAKKQAVEAAIQSILSKQQQQGQPNHPTTGQVAQQSKPTSSLPDFELTVSVPHTCVLLRASGGDSGAQGAVHAESGVQPKPVYLLLDVLCPSHAEHVSAVMLPPHQGPPFLRVISGKRRGELLMRHAATLEIAAARLRLYYIHQQPTPTHTTNTASTSHARGSSRANAPAPAGGSGAAARWETSCLVEVAPAAFAGGGGWDGARMPAPSSGHTLVMSGVGVGGGMGGQMAGSSQDIPPGCGLYTSILWDPDAPDCNGHNGQLVDHVQRYFNAHACKRWSEGGETDACEGEGEGSENGLAAGHTHSGEWGGRSSPGPGGVRALELEERCRRAAHAFIHTRLASVRIALSQTELQALTHLSGPKPTPDTTATGKDSVTTGAQNNESAPPAIRVTTLLQASVTVTLTPRSHTSTTPSHTSSPTHTSATPEKPPLPSFQLETEEFSLLHVSSLANGGDSGDSNGYSGGSVVSASLAGVKLLKLGSFPAGHATNRPVTASVATTAGPISQLSPWWLPAPDEDMCVLYCPAKPDSTALQPCVNVLVYQPPVAMGTHASDGGSASETGVSVLARGVTISTDHGSLTLDWAPQLGSLLSGPAAGQPPADSSSSSKGAAAAQPQQQPAAAAGTEKQAAAVSDRAGKGGEASSGGSKLVVTLQGDASKFSAPKQAASAADAATAGATAPAAPLALSPVALVLLTEHVRYESGGGGGGAAGDGAQHLIVINSVGLHLALAADRGAGWEPGVPCDVAGRKLQAAGYHCVLSETALRVAICMNSPQAPQPSAAAGAADAPQRPAAVDIDVRNQQLLGVLTQDSAALLLQLSAQVGAYMAAASAVPIPPRAAAAGPAAAKGSAKAAAPAAAKAKPASTAKAATATSATVTATAASAAAPAAAAGTGEDEPFASVTARTEQLMRQLLAQDKFFTGQGSGAGGAGTGVAAAGSSGQQPSAAAASQPGAAAGVAGHGPAAGPALGGTWFDAPQGSSSTQQLQQQPASVSAADSQTDQLPQPSVSTNSVPVVIIDDFFKVARSPRGSSDEEGEEGSTGHGLTGEWEQLPTAVPGLSSPLRGHRNSPPESPGVWYNSNNDQQPTSPTISNNKPLIAPNPTASHSNSARDTNGVMVGGVGMAGAETAMAGGVAGGVRVCEDYIPAVVSPTAAAAVGGRLIGVGVGAPARPCPSLRITFNNFAGLSVLHTTRGSGGAQAGRVEAEIEGATLVVEIYPQGGYEARMVHLSVRELEIRDCRAQMKHQHNQHHHHAHSAGYAHTGSDSGGVSAADRAASGGSRPGSADSGGGAAAHANGHARARVGSAAQTTFGAAQVRLGGAASRLAAGLPPRRSDRQRWVKILSYRQRSDFPRDSRLAQLEIVLDSVRPVPTTQPTLEELRLQVALLPVRLRLDQDVLSYLMAFGSAVLTPHTTAALELLSQLQLAAQSGGEAPALPFFQRVQVSACEFTIDYRPRHIDVAALRAGSLLELLGMVPIGGLELQLKPLALTGVAGWDGLGAAAVREWITHLAHTQAHKFLLGLAPVHALVRVSGAVAALLGAPPVARSVSRGVALAAGVVSAPFSALRQSPYNTRMVSNLRQGVVALSRLLVAEALAASTAVMSTSAGTANNDLRHTQSSPQLHQGHHNTPHHQHHTSRVASYGPTSQRTESTGGKHGTALGSSGPNGGRGRPPIDMRPLPSPGTAGQPPAGVPGAAAAATPAAGEPLWTAVGRGSIHHSMPYSMHQSIMQPAAHQTTHNDTVMASNGLSIAGPASGLGATQTVPYSSLGAGGLGSGVLSGAGSMGRHAAGLEALAMLASESETSGERIGSDLDNTACAVATGGAGALASTRGVSATGLRSRAPAQEEAWTRVAAGTAATGTAESPSAAATQTASGVIAMPRSTPEAGWEEIHSVSSVHSVSTSSVVTEIGSRQPQGAGAAAALPPQSPAGSSASRTTGVGSDWAAIVTDPESRSDSGGWVVSLAGATDSAAKSKRD